MQEQTYTPETGEALSGLLTGAIKFDRTRHIAELGITR
jgi:hypothetical protein